MATFSSRMISGSVVYIVLARLLDLEGFGLLSFGVTFAGLLAVMAEFGYSLMSQRDIPQNRFDLNRYVFNTLLQKVVLSVLAIIGGFIYLNMLFTGPNFKIGLIFIANAIVTSNNMYLFSVFRAKNKFKVETVFSLLYAVVLVVVIVVFYALDLSVYFIAYGLLFGRFLQMVLLVFIYLRIFSISFEIDKTIQRYLLKHSFSFGAHYIIGVFYFTIDNQLIALYAGNDALAIYQAFFKVVLILLSVNDLLNNVLIPYLSARFKLNDKTFVKTATLLNKVIMVLGLAMFVFINLFAEPIILFLYSEKYIAAMAIVLPLSFVLLFRIFTSMYSVLLTISDHQNDRVIIVFASLVVNVTLNYLVIPTYGFVGAAFVSLITHLILAGLYFLFGYKYLKSFLVSRNIVVISVITVVLILALYFFELKWNLWQAIVAMLLWMLSLVFIFTKKQRQEVTQLLSDGFA